MSAVGDRVYVLSGLVVEEWEVYSINGELYIRRAAGFGVKLGHPVYKHFETLEGAVAESQAQRERSIKRLAREIERLALNTNVKVKLMKPKKTRNPKGTNT